MYKKGESMGTLKNKLVLGSLLLITTFTSSVYALPMFERQTGLSCNACHSQQEPKLGRLGRDFLLSGMTLSDKVGMEDGKDADIQASIMFKSRYEPMLYFAVAIIILYIINIWL